jgi:hypothetical protein
MLANFDKNSVLHSFDEEQKLRKILFLTVFNFYTAVKMVKN